MKIDKVFYSSLLSLAIPIMLQNLLSTSLSFLDTLMIGQLGAEEIAAVGIANQIFFLVNLFIFGIASGSSVFFAQYFGAKQYEKMEKIMGLGLTLACLASFLWVFISLIFPRQIMLLFTDVEQAVTLGIEYQQIVAISYIFYGVSLMHSIGFRSVKKAKTPLIISLISLTINAIGNYLLIFGIGPFPILGVAGAAIATTLSRFIEMVILIILTYKNKEVFAIKNRQSIKYEKAFILNYFKVTLPVLINEVLWSLGVTVYKIAYAQLGLDTLASINVSEAIGNFFFVASLGIGNAATIIIGQALGSKNKEKAMIYAKKTIKIASLIGFTMGLLLFFSADFFASLFNVSSQIKKLAVLTMFVNAIFQPIKSVNMTIIVGVLRAGGDTFYALAIEMFSVWVIGVVLAFVGASYFAFPIYIVYFLVCMEELSKSIFAITRFKSGKWIKTLAN